MLASRTVVSTPEEIKEAVVVARALIGSDKWLNKQALLRPEDPLLNTTPSMHSQQGVIHHATTHDLTFMHPVAEAILGGEIIMAAHERTGENFVGKFLILLTSLRDIARCQHRIAGISERINKLKTPMWRATIYELLVACSLAEKHDVRLIAEGAKPTPDMVISDPALFFECKTRSAPEEHHLRFIQNFRRKVAGGIIQFSQKNNFGMRILIEVHDERVLDRLMGLIGDMLRRRKTVMAIAEVNINIAYYDGPPREFPHPMPMRSKEAWEWMMGFHDFEGWHYVLPGGEFQFSNFSNELAKAYHKPVLVCIRSTALVGKSANILNTIKSACKDQLREHQPGVVRMLINTSLFSVLSTMEEVLVELQALANELLEQYENRLVAVYFDVVHPPRFGDSLVTGGSVFAARQNVASLVSSLQPILLI